MPGSDPVADGRMDVLQGPEWLVDLLFGPPAWLASLVGVVSLGACVLAFRGLYKRDWTLDHATQQEMLANAVVVVAVMTTSVLAAWYTRLPYLQDVALGLGAGLAVAVAVNHWLEAWITARDGDGRRERFTAAWQGVAVLALVPMFLAGRGALPFVSRGGFIMLAAGVGMMTWNIIEIRSA